MGGLRTQDRRTIGNSVSVDLDGYAIHFCGVRIIPVLTP